MVFESAICLYCTLCCRNTEMILLEEDIERIERHIHIPRDVFAEYRGGFTRLRNVNGKCFFLDSTTGKCRIYEYRPLGCRIYPLIYDDVEGPILDPECPMSTSFISRRRDLEEGLKLLGEMLRKLEVEYKIHVNWRLFNERAKKLLSK